MANTTSNRKAKPFSQGYVLRTTVKHISKSLNISIKKTVSRIPEFAGDPEKSSEILTTLSRLQALQATVEAFELNNSEAIAAE